MTDRHERDFNERIRIVGWAIALSTLAVAGVWAAYLARHALLLIYVSAVLAIGFGPLVRAIEHQKIVPIGTPRLPRWLAILVVYLVIIGALTLVGILVIPPLVDQAGELRDRLPGFMDKAQTFLIKYGLLAERVTLEEAIRHAPGSPGATVGTVATAVTRIATTFFGIITVVILTFYLLVESRTLFAGFARIFRPERRPQIVEVAEQISIKVSAWLAGQLMLGAIIGSTAAVALYVLNVPYFYVLALIAAFGEMIPIVGPFLSAIPAILAGLAVSPRTALFVAIFWIVQQQIENHLLVPKIMERQVGVSPVTVVIALLIGASLMGLMGVLLAVPTAAILQVVIQELLEQRDRRMKSEASE